MCAAHVYRHLASAAGGVQTFGACEHVSSAGAVAQWYGLSNIAFWFRQLVERCDTGTNNTGGIGVNTISGVGSDVSPGVIFSVVACANW